MSLPPYLFLDLMLLHLCLCFYPFWVFVLIFFLPQFLHCYIHLSLPPQRGLEMYMHQSNWCGAADVPSAHTPNASVNLQHKETSETSVDSQLKFLIASLSLPEKLLSSTGIQTADRVALSPKTAVQQEPIRGFHLCWQKPISTREPPHHFLGEAVVISPRSEKKTNISYTYILLTYKYPTPTAENTLWNIDGAWCRAIAAVHVALKGSEDAIMH